MNDTKDEPEDFYIPIHSGGSEYKSNPQKPSAQFPENQGHTTWLTDLINEYIKSANEERKEKLERKMHDPEAFDIPSDKGTKQDIPLVLFRSPQIKYDPGKGEYVMESCSPNVPMRKIKDAIVEQFNMYGIRNVVKLSIEKQSPVKIVISIQQSLIDDLFKKIEETKKLEEAKRENILQEAKNVQKSFWEKDINGPQLSMYGSEYKVNPLSDKYKLSTEAAKKEVLKKKSFSSKFASVLKKASKIFGNKGYAQLSNDKIPPSPPRAPNSTKGTKDSRRGESIV